jgi:hypothetical protein
MGRRAPNEHQARLMKFITVTVILATVAAFSSLSFAFSQDRVQRIACVENQHAMCAAVYDYQADNAGVNPSRLRLAKHYYTGRPDDFGACPVDHVSYTYDRETGIVSCPNPAHRPH